MNPIESLEKVLASAKELQQKALLKTQQGEVQIRENLQQLFDQGLTLLGKGILTGRKASESFVAETHRKANRLKRTEDQVSGAPVSDATSEEPASDFIHASHAAPKSPAQSFSSNATGKKTRTKANKKGRAPLAATTRSH